MEEQKRMLRLDYTGHYTESPGHFQAPTQNSFTILESRPKLQAT